MSEIEPEDRGSAALIRSLFAPGDEDVIQWRPRELAGILTQEARCPLQCLPGNSNLTFFELMDCDHADPETLRAVKTWAKRQCQGYDDDRLPEPVAKVLYACVLIKASAQGVSLTRLSAAEIQNLVQWCLAQHWLPPEVASRLRRELSRFGRRG